MATSTSSPSGTPSEPENIPDCACLFHRVKRKLMVSRPIDPIAFEDNGAGVSGSWCKYADPRSCLASVSRPHAFGVVSLHVKDVRGLQLRVKHTPHRPSGAFFIEHADIIGQKTMAVRTKLADLALVAIEPEAEKISESQQKALKKQGAKKGA